jgi:opacity protein-like surface antigen
MGAPYRFFPFSRFQLLLLVVNLLLFASFHCAPMAQAQQYPVAEGYIGFTVLNNEYGTDRHNSPGIHLGFGYNAARYLRLVADFGAQNHSTNIVWTNGRRAQADDYQLLFGPELAIRKSPKATPFVHGLVGVAFRYYAVPTGNWICTPSSCYQDRFDIARENGFASAVGGGVDWHVHPTISVRLVQFDWIRTKLSRDNVDFSPVQGELPILKGWQDNYRFSCGVTFRFGQKGNQSR